MRCLRESIHRKRLELWKNNSWFLHHDNAPSHTAMVVREFLAKHSIKFIPQAPYSLDMAPCDFFLFNRLKNPQRGIYFDTIDIMKQKSLQVLKDISKHEYEKCFQDWIKRWHMCITSHGEFFQRDKCMH